MVQRCSLIEVRVHLDLQEQCRPSSYKLEVAGQSIRLSDPETDAVVMEVRPGAVLTTCKDGVLVQGVCLCCVAAESTTDSGSEAVALCPARPRAGVLSIP